MNRAWCHTQRRNRRVTAAFIRKACLCIMVAVLMLTMRNALCQSSPLYLRILVVNDAATAQKVSELLQQGKPFARLARQYSIHPTKQQGGFLGQVTLADLQAAVRMTVRNLQVGAVTGPIRVAAGLVFLQRTSMAHYAKALRLMRAEQYGAALTPLAQDLALNPDRINSLELKAYALERLGRPLEAEAVYRQIIRQAPDNILAHNNLGALRHQAGAPAEAARLFERAITLDPTQHVTLYNLAWLYSTELDELDRAQDYIRQAIARQPGVASNYALQGTIYQRQGKRQQARIALTRAIALDSQNTTYQNSLAALKTSGAASRPQPTAARRRSQSGSLAAVSRPTAPTATIKVVAHPGGAKASCQITRLLQQNGFPVARRLTDPKPMDGLRIYYKPHAIGTAESIRDLISASLRLQHLTWHSQFDIIVYIGQAVRLSTTVATDCTS